ncbi:hypothetical protein GCM10009107_03520 [Ideonella azotifigens]|uniref:Uncharacterized protein n=2 Tax=Ideonella azotifigens TaxID=513160 RepID=A0ABN1JJT9_9BURK
MSPSMMSASPALPGSQQSANDAQAADAGPDAGNNQRLRDLVDALGVSPAVALTLFNRGLGTSAHSDSEWKALMASPSTPRFRPLDSRLLAHAEQAFARAARPPRRGIQG